MRSAVPRRLRRITLAVTALASIAMLAGCSDLAGISRAATTLVAATSRTATIIRGSPCGLSVVVLDQDGAPLAGVPVVWAVTSGSGSLSSTSVTSNASGLASVTYMPASTDGAVVVTASATSLNAVDFAITVVASTIVAVNG